MGAKIKKVVYRKKHPYYTNKYSQKTEYEFYVDGELKYNSRMGIAYQNVIQFKKAMSKRFDIPVDQIEY